MPCASSKRWPLSRAWLGALALVCPLADGAEQGPTPQAGNNLTFPAQPLLHNSDTGLAVQPVLLSRKPAGDPRVYQYAKLANGLEVLNVLDAGSTQAAFAVAVTAGSFYDYSPKDEDDPKFLGLAHLTEHALFLGSRHFPKRSGFDSFLALHGGSSNAYTAEEDTVYFADLAAGAFPAGLIRFADLFRAPLLDKDAIWGEVSAVNSEHAKNRQSPNWRMARVMLSLASPASPLQWFHTGDDSTLRIGGKEDLADSMRAYFAKNYCPPRMRLVTFGPEPLAVQLNLSRIAFGDIPRRGESGRCADRPRQFNTPTPFNGTRLGQFLHVQGDTAQLWMLFPMPSLKRWHKSHPVLYLRYLIGYNAKGSLQHTLKDQLELAFGVTMWSEDTSAGTMLWIVADLMEKGAKHPDAVMDTIFSYLEKAKRQGVNGEALASLVKSEQLQREWASLPGPTSAASGLAEAMTRLRAEDLLTADGLVERPNATRVLEVMEQLSPENMNVCFIDPDASKKWDNKLKVRTLEHYGVKYTIQRLVERYPTWQKWGGWPDDAGDQVRLVLATGDTSLGTRLRTLDASMPAAPSMLLPGAIRDLPTQLSMELASAPKADGLVGRLWGPVPSRLNTTSSASGGDEAASELFYRQGWMLPRPKVEAVFSFRRPGGSAEANPGAILDLEVGMRMLNEQMSQQLDDLSRAGASWSLSLRSRGMSMGVGAFAPSVLGVARTVLAEFNKGVDVSDTKRRARVILGLTAELQDYSGLPVHQAAKEADVLLTPGVHSKAELLRALLARNITSAAAAAAVQDARRGPFSATGLVMGSCTSADALQLRREVFALLRADASLPRNSSQRITPVVQPAGPVELRAANPRAGDRSHVLYLTILVGTPSVEQRVLLGLVGNVLSQVIFAELRTRLQLGYIVGGDVSQRSNVLTVSCYVQGEQLLPDALEAQCEKVFAVTVPHALASMSDGALQAQKAAYRGQVLQKPVSVQEEASHFEGLIELGSCFRMEEALLEVLDTITSKQQLIDAWTEAVLPPAGGLRRKLAVKYWGHGHTPTAAADPGAMAAAVRDIGGGEAAAKRIQAEHSAMVRVASANSTTRAQLVKAGGFFPLDLFCERASSAKTVSSPRSSSGASGASTLAQPAAAGKELLRGLRASPPVPLAHMQVARHGGGPSLVRSEPRAGRQSGPPRAALAPPEHASSGSATSVLVSADGYAANAAVLAPDPPRHHRWQRVAAAPLSLLSQGAD